MNRWTCNVWLGGVALLCALPPLLAETKDNPFGVIVDRNAFRLRPPPDTSTNTPPPPPPPPSNVKMTGVFEWKGVKKVLLEITDPVSKKVEKPSPLTEGDTQGQVTVVSIDVKEGKVKIKNGTEETTLGFEVPKVAGGPGGPPGPGIPGMPVPIPSPLGGPRPFGLPAPATTSAAAPSGSGNVLVSGASGGTAVNPAAATPAINPSFSSTGFGIPARPLRSGADSGNVLVGGYGSNPGAAADAQAAQAQAAAVNREQLNRLMMENYEKAKQAAQSGAISPNLPGLMPLPQNFIRPTPPTPGAPTQ